MSDPCKGPFLDCIDRTVNVVTSAHNSGGIKHSISHSLIGLYNEIELPFLKTVRTYDASWAGYYQANVNNAITTYPSFTDTSICSSPSYDYNGKVTENCSITTIKILFFDPFQKVLLYEKNEQTLFFEVSSSEIQQFKEKFGIGTYVKLKVKNTVVVHAKQSFILLSVQDDLHEVLHEYSYTFNPFPDTSGSGTWGLYGDQIIKDTTNYEEGVSMIILYPAPGSQGIPINDGTRYGGDVIHYGFYDYNAIAGGFISTDLPDKDGGKDMYYPEWCRNMCYDSVWRRLADRRFALRWSNAYVPLQDSALDLPSPDVTNYPVGSAIVSPIKGSFYSFVIIDHGGNVKCFNGVKPINRTNYVTPTLPKGFTEKVYTTYAKLGVI